MGEWIAHDGGKCPVYVDTKVDVRWKGDAPDKSFCAQTGALPIEAGYVAAWPLVTHYRLAEPEQPSEQAHIPIPGAFPLQVVIDEFRKDPAFAAEMDKARIDLQAHMMAAPRNRMLTADELEASIRACYPESEAPTTERKHVSDAAAESVSSELKGLLGELMRLCERHDVVLLTVAEHDRLEHKAEILRQTKIMYTELSEERDNLRAELAARTQAWEGEEFKLRGELSDAKCEIERLRKGREDEKGAHTTAEAARVEDARKLAPIHADLAKAKTLASNFTDLDPRLGTPQPEGEPVGPRPGRRWVPIL